MNLQSAIIMMPIIGIVLVASYGFGGTLATASDITQLEPLNITTTYPNQTPIENIDMGTASTITVITFNFKGSLASSTTVTVSIKDTFGTEIGSGTKVLTSSSDVVTVSLSNSITAAERPTITSMSVSAS